MVQSISNAEAGIQKLMTQMVQNLNNADTDGVKGLSKEELNSIDAKNNIAGAGFAKFLSSQFEKIDTDENGQLSAKEIASSKPLGQLGKLGAPTGLELNQNKSENALGNFPNSFVQKLLNAYQSTNLSSVASSLSLAL